MRISPALLTCCLALPAFTGSVMAQTRHAATAKPVPTAPAPKSLGKFGDWQAATHAEGDTLVCYAFTRAAASTPAIAGRGDIVLTVTQRPGARDTVAISAGLAYAAAASVTVTVAVDQQSPLEFYTAQRSAFARDGRAVVAAFHKGKRVAAKSPGPKGAPVIDQFSLAGFDAAYTASLKACPGK